MTSVVAVAQRPPMDAETEKAARVAEVRASRRPECRAKLQSHLQETGPSGV